jgi:hypothetical protein
MLLNLGANPTIAINFAAKLNIGMCLEKDVLIFSTRSTGLDFTA